MMAFQRRAGGGAPEAQNGNLDGSRAYLTNASRRIVLHIPHSSTQLRKDRVLRRGNGKYNTPNASGVDVVNGHLDAGDFIPPFEFEGQTVSQIWNAKGQLYG